METDNGSWTGQEELIRERRNIGLVIAEYVCG